MDVKVDNNSVTRLLRDVLVSSVKLTRVRVAGNVSARKKGAPFDADYLRKFHSYCDETWQDNETVSEDGTQR